MLVTEVLPRAADTELIRSEDALVALAEPWAALDGDIPFRAWQWCHAWWQHYRDPGDELFVVAVRDSSGNVVGIAPWYRSHSHKHGRVLRFLGCGEVCSDYLTILARSGSEREVSRQIARWLASAGRDEWDLLELSGVARDDVAVRSLVDELAGHGHLTHELAVQSCWCVPLPESWEAYLSQLSKGRRERIRMLERRQFATGRARMYQVRSQDDLEQGFAILCDLHQRRRQSLNEQGAFASARFTKFHRDVAGRFLEMGRLRLQWVELEGRPAAAEYDLTGGPATYFYQSGIHPGFLRECPGWLSFMAAIQRAIGEGCTQFDMLRGDERYKSHWRAVGREMCEIRVIGRSAAARMRHQIWMAYQKVKTWKRRPSGTSR